MAIWAGTNINSNETAMLFNQMWDRKGMAIVQKKHALAFAMLGKMDVKSTPGITNFERTEKTSGNKVEKRLLGELYDPAEIADSAQTDAVTLSWNTDAWGGAEWPLAHFSHTFPIPNSEVDRIRGDEAKTLSYFDEFLEMVALSYQKKWGTRLNATGSGGLHARDKFGSVPYCIEGVDGTWTDSADDYGTIARDDSANADFRGQVQASVGTLTLDKIRTSTIAAEAYLGDIKVGTCGSTVYNKIHQLVEPYSVVNYDAEWTKFGGKHVEYAGVKYAYDPDAASGYLILLDPTTWKLFMKENVPMTQSGIVFDFTKKGTYVLPTQFWMQWLCMAPARNAIMKGITG